MHSNEARTRLFQVPWAQILHEFLASLKLIYVSQDNLKIDEICEKMKNQKLEFEAQKLASRTIVEAKFMF